MRRLLIAAAILLVPLAGCANQDYDPGQCDFYRSLGQGWIAHQGYIPADTQASIDQYCTR